MAKLEFYFKKKEEDWTNLEETDLLTDIRNGNSTMYIGIKEDRTLKEMAEGVQKQLRKRGLLRQDEELEMTEFNKSIIGFEREKGKKVDATVYSLCKFGYEAVKEGKTTWEHLIKVLEESRCSECM